MCERKQTIKPSSSNRKHKINEFSKRRIPSLANTIYIPDKSKKKKHK